MNIWIVQDGEKNGPFQEFEIRRLYEAGKINANTPVWHANLDGWHPLSEVEGLRHLAEEKTEAAPPPPETAPEQREAAPQSAAPLEANAPVDPDGVPRERHLARRFWARWFDLQLYCGLWWLLMWASARDIEALFSQPWIMLLLYVPWFAIEAVMIHRFATTPGKWLLGLKVLNVDGSQLSLGASTLRCARVLFMGIGFGVQPLVLICQLLSWITTRKIGRPLWDRAGDHFVDARPLRAGRSGLCVLGFLTALWLQSIVLSPYYMPEMINLMEQYSPQTAEQIKANPPWHLPPRN